MKKYLPDWPSVLLAAFCLFSFPAVAQPVAGSDYAVIDPAQPTDDPDRIEVIEFFSYGCPHCNDLNPLIQLWVGDLPRDVLFRRVPVSFNPFYVLMTRLFYTLDATDDLARLDGAVFAALHEKNLQLVSEKSIADWAVSQGVDARRFSEAWNSFSVEMKMKQADQATRNHHIQGVPAIVVDGRYRVGGKSLQELLRLTDEVIEMRRAERKESAKK
jgi:thiol:disulfide interchange protein DsbA